MESFIFCIWEYECKKEQKNHKSTKLSNTHRIIVVRALSLVLYHYRIQGHRRQSLSSSNVNLDINKLEDQEALEIPALWTTAAMRPTNILMKNTAQIIKQPAIFAKAKMKTSVWQDSGPEPVVELNVKHDMQPCNTTNLKPETQKKSIKTPHRRLTADTTGYAIRTSTEGATTS